MGQPRKVIPDWGTSQELIDLDFHKKAARYRFLKGLADRTEEERKELSVELEMILEAAGMPKVMFEGMVASKRNGGQPPTISATKLLELGVDADVIAQATIPGAKYTYFEMREPKGKGKGQGQGQGANDGDDE